LRVEFIFVFVVFDSIHETIEFVHQEVDALHEVAVLLVNRELVFLPEFGGVFDDCGRVEGQPGAVDAQPRYQGYFADVVHGRLPVALVQRVVHVHWVQVAGG